MFLYFHHLPGKKKKFALASKTKKDLKDNCSPKDENILTLKPSKTYTFFFIITDLEKIWIT